MCEGGADEFVDFKSTVLGKEQDFRGRKWVVFGQLQDSVIEPSCEVFFESEKAEVVDQVGFLHNDGLRKRVSLYRLLLLLQTQRGYFFIH